MLSEVREIKDWSSSLHRVCPRGRLWIWVEYKVLAHQKQTAFCSSVPMNRVCKRLVRVVLSKTYKIYGHVCVSSQLHWPYEIQLQNKNCAPVPSRSASKQKVSTTNNNLSIILSSPSSIPIMRTISHIDFYFSWPCFVWTHCLGWWRGSHERRSVINSFVACFPRKSIWIYVFRWCRS